MKLTRSFYQRPALEIASDFLGKYLVHDSEGGRISGIIIDVEAYPAYVDSVSHGNKRTKRTEIMYERGGFAYVYLVYGIHHQFAVVVNKANVPEVVFVRAVIPKEGISIMQKNFGKKVAKPDYFTKSPGNLCKSFGINLDYYGTDLTKDILYIEDRGVRVANNKIKSSRRIGISKKLQGAEKKYRYYFLP